MFCCCCCCRRSQSWGRPDALFTFKWSTSRSWNYVTPRCASRNSNCFLNFELCTLNSIESFLTSSFTFISCRDCVFIGWAAFILSANICITSLSFYAFVFNYFLFHSAVDIFLLWCLVFTLRVACYSLYVRIFISLKGSLVKDWISLPFRLNNKAYVKSPFYLQFRISNSLIYKCWNNHFTQWSFE